MWELAGMVVLVAMLTGIVLGWVAYFRVRSLEQQLRELKRRLDHSDTIKAETLTASPQQSQVSPSQAGHQSMQAEFATPPNAPDIFPELPDLDASSPSIGSSQSADNSTLSTDTPSTAILPGLFGQWRSQWMIWLGGLCVALAGIFMVRYSIDQGLLSPAARIGLALATGIGFHMVAEWLRRTRGGHAAFAALAGGASITLYGALLAGLHLYQLFNANLVFILLALVSLATMVLALRQGSVLAAIGILGGYVVPVLVSTGSGNMVAAMLYGLIIFAAGLVLIRYVFRQWLLWGLIAGIV
ncbi:MAG: DUF2339 domain-containing protein, partial [Porticoccaceae bacterium]